MGTDNTTNLGQISVKSAFCVFGALFATTAVAAAVSTNLQAFADTSIDDVFVATIEPSCTFSGDAVNNLPSATIIPGNTSTIDGSTITAICNNGSGFDIYAVGLSGNKGGNNKLIYGGDDATYDIATGTATSGNTSSWAMQVTKGTNTGIAIDNNFDSNSYHTVPSTYAKVAHSGSATTSSSGSTIITKYQIYAAPSQVAGTYNGQVQYTLINPHVDGTTNAPATPVTFEDATYLQDVNSCPSTLATEQTYTLKDSRDNQEYTVAKLKDGKCWMTKNLNLAGGTALTAANTDMNSGANMSTTNGFQSGNKLPASSLTGFSDNTTAYVYNSGSTNCGSDPSTGTPCYSYYSWTAATLGSGLSLSSSASAADSSVCPKGWRLPTSGNSSVANGWKSGDFYGLFSGYGANLASASYDYDSSTTSATLTAAGPGTAANLSLNGYIANGSYSPYETESRATVIDPMITGYYWSSTAGSSYYAGSGYISGSYIDSASDFARKNGLAVRCVLRQ